MVLRKYVMEIKSLLSGMYPPQIPTSVSPSNLSGTSTISRLGLERRYIGKLKLRTKRDLESLLYSTGRR